MTKEMLEALKAKHQDDCIDRITARVGELVLKFPSTSLEMVSEIMRHMCESCLESVQITIDTFEEVFREMDREHEHDRKSRVQR